MDLNDLTEQVGVILANLIIKIIVEYFRGTALRICSDFEYIFPTRFQLQCMRFGKVPKKPKITCITKIIQLNYMYKEQQRKTKSKSPLTVQQERAESPSPLMEETFPTTSIPIRTTKPSTLVKVFMTPKVKLSPSRIS